MGTVKLTYRQVRGLSPADSWLYTELRAKVAEYFNKAKNPKLKSKKTRDSHKAELAYWRKRLIEFTLLVQREEIQKKSTTLK